MPEKIENETWYVYMIECDNRGKHSRFYGLETVFVTGKTQDIKKELIDYLNGRDDGFVNKYFKDSSKKLIYVECLNGTESVAHKREKQIKNMSKKKKKEIINSTNNHLIRYVPCKAIILKNINGDGEIALKIR